MEVQCEMPDSNPLEEDIKQLLQKSNTIAVVGISRKEDRDSYKVAKYLKEHGFKIIPVNPRYEEVLGEKCSKSLSDIPFSVDIVDIFRKPESIPPIVDEAIKIGAKAVWMQLGLAHNASAKKAREAGLEVVMNKCIKIEHSRLLRETS